MTDHVPLDGRIHQRLINGMIDAGRCPSNDDLARACGVAPAESQASLQRLACNHGLVLHPNDDTVWLVHPFAASPSNFWVQKDGNGWWAPCMWCALGVAVLVGGTVNIHARIGGEAESIQMSVDDGYPEDIGILAHFALPPKRAWDNVHHYCAMLLPFRNERQIDDWSNRHGLPRGVAVPIAQAAALARSWYGAHANSDYRKWTLPEAQQIFSDVGLTGPFWNLGAGTERF